MNDQIQSAVAEFRKAFVIAVGEKSPFAKEALGRLDAALQAQASGQAVVPTASEAVYAFAAWLSCRTAPVTFSSVHDAALPARLVDAFVRSQGWEAPGLDYPTRLRPYPADCPTCNNNGAVGNILTAEPCPDCTPTPEPVAVGKDLPEIWLSWNDAHEYGYWSSQEEAELSSAEDFEPVRYVPFRLDQQAVRDAALPDFPEHVLSDLQEAVRHLEMWAAGHAHYIPKNGYDDPGMRNATITDVKRTTKYLAPRLSKASRALQDYCFALDAIRALKSTNGGAA